VVRGGKMPYAIVRPTIVLGLGSPILAKLRALAGGPVVAVIGNGKARVQPIDVGDVTDGLHLVLEKRAFDGTTRELGGPEVLSMQELLVRIRAALGKPSARVVHVPYGPMRGGLIALEALLAGRSPVSAGQISAFVSDSVAAPDPLWAELTPRLASLERMLGA
jgi:NADH dehydrogenase